jgi:transcription elongation GreA/GreB family factor
MKRHEQMLETLGTGGMPILPFERELAEEDFQTHVDEQHSLSKTLGEAMSQSSETWHDNAPADAVATASIALYERAVKTAEVVHKGVIFDYPEADESRVTLGSLVGYFFGSAAGPEDFVYLTGRTRRLPDPITKAMGLVLDVPSADVEVATINSPLAISMLGKVVGERFDYAPNGKSVAITINRVLQLEPDSEL